MTEKMEMSELQMKVDRELVERNARVAKCNLKLAERLAEYCRFYRDTTTIGLVMTAFGASTLGYFGRGMTMEDIMNVGWGNWCLWL